MSSDQGSTHGNADKSQAQDGFASLLPMSVFSNRSIRADDAELREHGPEERRAIEHFIRGRFENAFGSRLDAFMPRLLSLRDSDGFVLGALGLRGADRPLFLEQYLDAPIEMEIAARTGSVCRRDVVVEVGHLSGTYPGAVRRIIDLLTRRLHDEGVRWVTFTGTASLRNAFHRMGLAPIEIASASRERLPESERSAWGRYYDDAPRVFFGNVQEGHRQLSLQATSAMAAHS
jgi:hypothetical protein